MVVAWLILAVLPISSWGTLPPAIQAMNMREFAAPNSTYRLGNLVMFCYRKGNQYGVVKIDVTQDQAPPVTSQELGWCKAGGGCNNCHAGG